jgi:hypothetical protein
VARSGLRWRAAWTTLGADVGRADRPPRGARHDQADSLKRLVRARMADTGQSYTTAAAAGGPASPPTSAMTLEGVRAWA